MTSGGSAPARRGCCARSGQHEVTGPLRVPRACARRSRAPRRRRARARSLALARFRFLGDKPAACLSRSPPRRCRIFFSSFFAFLLLLMLHCHEKKAENCPTSGGQRFFQGMAGAPGSTERPYTLAVVGGGPAAISVRVAVVAKRGSPVPRSLARFRYLFEQLGSSFCPSCWDHGTARSLRFRATPPLAWYCLNPGVPNDSVVGVSAITTSSESLRFPVHAARAERTCPRSRAAPTLLRASLCATC